MYGTFTSQSNGTMYWTGFGDQVAQLVEHLASVQRPWFKLSLAATFSSIPVTT